MVFLVFMCKKTVFRVYTMITTFYPRLCHITVLHMLTVITSPQHCTNNASLNVIHVQCSSSVFIVTLRILVNLVYPVQCFAHNCIHIHNKQENNWFFFCFCSIFWYQIRLCKPQDSFKSLFTCLKYVFDTPLITIDGHKKFLIL